jgi:hypothetical protein
VDDKRHGRLATMLTADIYLGLQAELERADQWPAYNSAHEGYGVLMEEINELEMHVFNKQVRRNLGAMRKEALQVAAVALRIARDICNEERGRK